MKDRLYNLMDVNHLSMPFNCTSICLSTKPIAWNIKHGAFNKASAKSHSLCKMYQMLVLYCKIM
jgi:hypothetical protein